MYEIVFTGFGKFPGQDLVNSSREAVFKLPDYLEIHSRKFLVKKIEVPVAYESASKIVTTIWSNNPVLVIHCGAHETSTKILLEKCSNTSGYCLEDINDDCLDENEICTRNNKCAQLNTKFKVEKIAAELNKEHKPMFDVSCNVGNYLCGFIYVKSLDHDPNRTLFLHVPQLKFLSADECKNGIVKIVEKCIHELIVSKKIN